MFLVKILHDMKGLFGCKYYSFKKIIWRKANLIQMKHVLSDMLYYTRSYGMGIKLEQDSLFKFVLRF